MQDGEDSDETRPALSAALDWQEYARWYWPVEAMQAFCATLGLPASGSKADLRARIAFALKHPDAPLPKEVKPAKKSRFKWASEVLTLDTVITDNVSFGPNVRRFFAQQIGAKFVCHGDFMDWMRSNEGSTLGDGIAAWLMLEERKLDLAFRREIAKCNNYLQYLRDLRDAHPELTLDQAKVCWDQKKIRPAQDGFVVFEASDLRFLT